MKKNNKNSQSLNILAFEEYKKIIDKVIADKTIDKLKLQQDYFDICGNYWIVDKYISKYGQISPEMIPNTFEAYDAAIEHDFALLIPVQMLDDGNIVCFSHKNLSKVITSTDGYLNKLTLPEVKNIDLNDKGDKIPTLDEALEHIANRTPIIIDIQNDGMIGKFEDKILLSLKNYIEKYNCYNLVAVGSLNPFSLQYCFQQYPYITRILKSGNFTEKMYGSIPTKKLKKLKFYKITKADFISYSYELLPCMKVEKHKPVGTIAHTITNQNQYLAVASHADNIVFSHFKPTI